MSAIGAAPALAAAPVPRLDLAGREAPGSCATGVAPEVFPGEVPGDREPPNDEERRGTDP